MQGLVLVLNILYFTVLIKWGDYNYDYDERSIHRSRYDYSPMRFRFVKLIWSEHDKTAEYTLKFNGTKRGLWIGTEPPRGKQTKRKDLCCLHPFKWVNFKCKFYFLGVNCPVFFSRR